MKQSEEKTKESSMNSAKMDHILFDDLKKKNVFLIRITFQMCFYFFGIYFEKLINVLQKSINVFKL